MAPMHFKKIAPGVHSINDSIFNIGRQEGEGEYTNIDGDSLLKECEKEKDVDVLMDTVVIMDVDGRTLMSEEMTSKALKHLKDGKHFIEMWHGTLPINDYNDPKLYAMLYQTLFPYSVGSPDGVKRMKNLSFEAHVWHLFKLKDLRFWEHCSFMFVAINVMQWHVTNLSTSLSVRRPYVASFANELTKIKLDMF